MNQITLGSSCPVVKASAYAGILLWFVIFAICGINLMIVPADGSSRADADFDKVAMPTGLVLSFGGIAVSAGMRRAKVWADRMFVAGLGFVAIPVGVIAFVGMELSLATAGVGVLCTFAMLLRHVLLGTGVRTIFGLAPEQRQLLRGPGGLNLGMGVLTISLVVWPQPTPMFGVWLQRWQALIMNLVFGVGQLTLGWGMLKACRWICIGLVLVDSATPWATSP
jgi:hypothetical protein